MDRRKAGEEVPQIECWGEKPERDVIRNSTADGGYEMACQKEKWQLQEAQSNFSPSAEAKVTAVWLSSGGVYANKCKLMHNCGNCTHLAPRHQEAHDPSTWKGQVQS